MPARQTVCDVNVQASTRKERGYDEVLPRRRQSILETHVSSGHGRHDRYVPLPWIQWLQRRMTPDTRLWVIEAAQQASAVEAARQHHCASVARFFHRQMASEPTLTIQARVDSGRPAQPSGSATSPTVRPIPSA